MNCCRRISREIPNNVTKITLLQGLWWYSPTDSLFIFITEVFTYEAPHRKTLLFRDKRERASFTPKKYLTKTYYPQNQILYKTLVFESIPCLASTLKTSIPLKKPFEICHNGFQHIIHHKKPTPTLLSQAYSKFQTTRHKNHKKIKSLSPHVMPTSRSSKVSYLTCLLKSSASGVTSCFMPQKCKLLWWSFSNSVKPFLF